MREIRCKQDLTVQSRVGEPEGNGLGGTFKLIGVNRNLKGDAFSGKPGTGIRIDGNRFLKIMICGSYGKRGKNRAITV